MSLPKSVTKNNGKHVVVAPEVHRKLREIAFYEDTTMCALIAEFAENYVIKNQGS